MFGNQHYPREQSQKHRRGARNVLTIGSTLVGYGEDLRQQAVRLYVDGINFRRIARYLGVHHQTVINWINAHVASLPDQPPLPSEVRVVEQDELFTFIGNKKTKSIS